MNTPIFDAASSSSDASGLNSTLTMSHTSTGNLTHLVVFLMVPTGRGITSITHNGNNLSLVSLRTGLTAGFDIGIYTGKVAAGTANIVATISGNDLMCMVAGSYLNVGAVNGGSYAETVTPNTVLQNSSLSLDNFNTNIIAFLYSGASSVDPNGTPYSGAPANQTNRKTERLSNNSGLILSDIYAPVYGSTYYWEETLSSGTTGNLMIANTWASYGLTSDPLFFDGN